MLSVPTRSSFPPHPCTATTNSSLQDWGRDGAPSRAAPQLPKGHRAPSHPPGTCATVRAEAQTMPQRNTAPWRASPSSHGTDTAIFPARSALPPPPHPCSAAGMGPGFGSFPAPWGSGSSQPVCEASPRGEGRTPTQPSAARRWGGERTRGAGNGAASGHGTPKSTQFHPNRTLQQPITPPRPQILQAEQRLLLY